jgi:hypothetical protein
MAAARQERHRHRTNEPGDDGRRTSDGRDEEGAEQPTGADDRPFRGEQLADEADVPFQTLVVGPFERFHPFPF